MDVIQYPSKELRRVSSKITSKPDNLDKLVSNLIVTMYDYNGIGLAAPQVGIHKAIAVIDYEQLEGDKSPFAIINPKIIESEGTQTVEEGCLSVPGSPAAIDRHQFVKVVALDDNMNEVTYEAEGLQAAVFQHEIDHLYGTLFFDHLSRLKKDMYTRKIKKSIRRGEAWRSHTQTFL